MVILEFAFIFICGAIGYGSIEMLWRGHTHWTMLLLGGVCLYLIYLISTRMREKLWQKLLMCAAAISALEFAVGCLVNLRLGWAVWDYSDMPYNLFGQICPTFSLMWLLLSLPCIYASRFIYRFIFQPNMKEKKHS